MNLGMNIRSLSRVMLLALIGLAPRSASAQSFPALLPLERDLRRSEPVLQRVAVVLGLSAYGHAPQLRNAVNDARSVAALLRDSGFRVIEGYDLDKISIERLLRDVVMAGGTRSEVVVYFAGHGIQIADSNYLLPVDAQLADPYDVPFETISLDSILETIRGQSERQIAFLDACRNNPFEGVSAITNARGVGAPVQRGFSQPRPPADTLLSFSTAPGTLALDGDGANSPYTSALVGAAGLAPESSITEILEAVEQLVAKSTGGRQRPTFVSALNGSFALRAPSVAPKVGESTNAPLLTDPVGTTFPLPGDATGDLIVPRERIIALGERLTEVLNLDGAKVVFGPPPPGTSYAMVSADGIIAEAPTTPVPASELGSIVLRLDKVAADDVSPTTGVVTQDLTFERLDPGGYRTPRALTISIVPNPCDVEAGDWFDPQGVGLHRLDKAIRATETIAACRAALQADPDSARFRYQLARGYRAAGNAADAESLARQAAEAGHIRAWLEYGKLLKGRGALNEAGLAFERGQRAGDPRATAALGALRLETATTESEREAAYALLTEGIDLGLWEAMEAQSEFFNGVGQNPTRASRYFSEAQRRRADVVPASVPDP